MGALRDGLDTWDAAEPAGDSYAQDPDATRPTILSAGTSPAKQAAIAAVEEAMRVREARAMRGFMRLVIGLCVAVLVSVPLLHTSLDQRVMLVSGLSITLCGALYAWMRAARGPLAALDTAIFGVACMIGGTAGIWFFGFYSPAPIVTVMGIFFFGIQRSIRMALLLYLGAAITHGGIMIAMAFGWMHDNGVLSSEDVSTRNRLVMIALVEVVFALTLALARAVHRAILAASIKLEETTRMVAHREALLEEARRELEHALEVGGPGRFTEQRLGAWQLGVLCGRGAMGDVYEATRVPPTPGGERAAVKLLTRAVSSDKAQVRRFLREARIAASIDVVNVVKVIDVAGEDAPVPYIAMELLRGTDLAAILRRRRRLARDEAVQMLREIGRGLDAAHAVGVVHRDLKPQNLFLAEPAGAEPVWKILDFGVSRVVDVDSSLTRGQAVGTPAYMSPEQARGAEVDKRGDLFALGVLAYRVLVGRPAFTGHEVPQILYRVVHAMPPRPSEVAADLPAAIDDVLAIALAKRPADRFESAAAFVEAVEAALRGELRGEHAGRAAKILAKTPWGDRTEAIGDA
ncbi:MAG TPA: serine/threonine-protein kinase [Kofleriaceae bacterium]|nr:serine/threonine-protein kinase [Kofleriaceae bacterium]